MINLYLVGEMREGKVFVRFGQRPGFRRSVGVVGRRQLDRRVGELDVEVPRVRLAHHLRLERRSDLKRSQSKQVQSQGSGCSTAVERTRS